MDARLLVVGGKANKGSVKLKLPSIIGRSSKATITIGHPMVSRQHCELFESNSLLMLRDLGSTNGTFFDGKRVKEAPLPPNSEFTVGPLTFRVEYKYAGGLTSLPRAVFFEAPAETPKPTAASEPDFEVLGSISDDDPAAFAPLPAAPTEEGEDFFAELGITGAAEPATEPAEWLPEEAFETPAAAKPPSPEPKKASPAVAHPTKAAAKTAETKQKPAPEQPESIPAVATPSARSAAAAEPTAAEAEAPAEDALEPLLFEPVADEPVEAELIEEFDEVPLAEEVAHFGEVHELEEEELEHFEELDEFEELPVESEVVASAESDLKQALDELVEKLPAVAESVESAATDEEPAATEEKPLDEEAIVAELTEVKEQLERAVEDLAPLDELATADGNDVAEALETLSVAEEEQDLVAFDEIEAVEEVQPESLLEEKPFVPAESAAIEAATPKMEAIAASSDGATEQVAFETLIESPIEGVEQEPVEFESLSHEAPSPTIEEAIELVEETTFEPTGQEMTEPVDTFEPETTAEPVVTETPSASPFPELETSPFGEPPTVPQPAFFVDEPPPEFFEAAEFDGVSIQAANDCPSAPVSPAVSMASDAISESTTTAAISDDEVIDFLDATSVSSDMAPATAELANPVEFEPFFDAADELVPAIEAVPSEAVEHIPPAVEFAEFQPEDDVTEASEANFDQPDESLPTEEDVAEASEEEAVAEVAPSPRVTSRKPNKLPWFVSIFKKTEKKERLLGKETAKPEAAAPEAPSARIEDASAGPAAQQPEPSFEPVAEEDAPVPDAEPDAEKKAEDEKYNDAFDDFLKGL